MEKIGILGSGPVATALAKGFLDEGHAVMFGTRSPDKLDAFVADHRGVQTGSFADAAAFGDVLVLAVKGTAALDVLAQAGADNLRGKTILDTTNPIADAPPVNGVIQLFTGPNDSLLEHLQTAYPDAHFVKAFSCIGNPFMVHPDFGGERPAMFICGNDDVAKQWTAGLVERFGFEAEDMGRAESARCIEPLVSLWCLPGFLRGEWTHAFRMVRVKQPAAV
jgi:predicted dinucleotide-binding enzyme